MVDVVVVFGDVGQMSGRYIIVTISVLGVGRLHLDGVVHLQGRDRDIWRTQTTEDMARDIVYTPHRILSNTLCLQMSMGMLFVSFAFE